MSILKKSKKGEGLLSEKKRLNQGRKTGGVAGQSSKRGVKTC